MKTMTQNRKAMLSKMINQAESCLSNVNEHKVIRQHQYDFLNKGCLVTKEDYALAIHRMKQKIAWMNNSITHFKEAIEMLERLNK